MTALDDILAAAEARKAAPRPAWFAAQRLVLVLGHSAARSLIVGLRQRADAEGKPLPTELPLMINGMAIQRTEAFPGWEIREL